MAIRLVRGAASGALGLAALVHLAPVAAASDNLVENGSFESPVLGVGTPWTAIPDAQIGWGSTEGSVEVWNGPAMGVPAFDGVQFIELNYNVPGSVRQDIVTVPGELLRWSLAHRARDGAGETMRVLAGPGGGSGTTGLSVLTPETKDGAPATTAVIEGGLNWAVWAGEYVVPGGQTLTRFAFEAITPEYGMGNLVDDIRVIAAGMAASESQEPPPVLQAVPVPASGSCAEVDAATLEWGGGIDGGWARSWEPWVGADGNGGWACARLLQVERETWRAVTS